MKDMLNHFYEQYPMAKKNFIRMLYNEEQLCLWKREDDHKRIKEEARKPIVLLQEQDNTLLQRGHKTFLCYHPQENPTMLRKLKISDDEKEALLHHTTTFQEIIAKYAK